MTLIVDAGPIVALADAGDPLRDRIRDALVGEDGPLIIPAPVTAEIDYLLGTRFGSGARRAFLSDLAEGRFTVECLDQTDYATALDLEHRYADLQLGLADCAIVAIAARMRTRRVLTIDDRHFRAVRPLQGGTFVLLPADA